MTPNATAPVYVDHRPPESAANEDRTVADQRSPGRRSAVDVVSTDWRLGAAITLAAAALYGLIAAWWTPRGPLTSVEALAAIAISLVVGTIAGVSMRTRWALLLAPVAFAAVFELARLGTAGPTVDRFSLRSTYGILAFVVGRGIHGVLALVPMLLGATLGAAAARRRVGASPVPHGRANASLRTRRTITGLVAVGLVALTLGIIRPAHTAAIRGANGHRLAGSVAQLTRVQIGGHNLAMMIRGDSIDNPVLLFLAGGPGGTEMGAMRKHGQALEHDFVVVTFDQRGSGKSYDNLEPTSSLTLAGAVSDATEVTNYLRQRFHQDKIYVLGQSWGTILGVLAVQQHPELYRAFIGAGQMVSPRATDITFYQDTLAWARRTHKTRLVQQLTRSGPPPYKDILNYEPALSFEKDVYPYDHTHNAEGAGGFSENIFVGEYSLMEQIHTLGGFLDVFAIMYPQLQNIDFRTQVTQLKVPVYLAQGRYEAPGRAQPAQEWFNLLDAPSKQMVTFETSGHRDLFEQPDQFHQFMTGTVLAQTHKSPTE